MIYELRHYVAETGRALDLLDRFERHTLPLFDELGFELLHFWHETERPDHIWYILVWRNEAAMKNGWERMRANPVWSELKARTEAQGPLIRRIRSRVLSRPGAASAAGRRADEEGGSAPPQ